MKLPVLGDAEHEPGLGRGRMRLEEYLDFVWYFLRDADPDKIEAQRRTEEKIEQRFYIPKDG